jgi:hypothetical protein
MLNGQRKDVVLCALCVGRQNALDPDPDPQS